MMTIRPTGEDRLSPREKQVYQLTREGASLADMCKDLGITKSTVMMHRRNAYMKVHPELLMTRRVYQNI